MMTNSKELFHNLVKGITLPEKPAEIQSIVYRMMDKKLGLSHSEIMTGKKITDTVDWQPMLDRINRHEPLQYVLEEAWFYGRPFYVNSSVLIPRPETELLVEEVQNYIATRPDGKAIYILDACTGSGCIAVTLALEIENAKIVATDISKEALVVANRNATHHSVFIDFIQHDLLSQSIHIPVDLIVCNPPYISQQEKKEMQKNVLHYEPSLALFAPEEDPLAFYRALAENGKSALSPGGVILAEINEHLGSETAGVFLEKAYHTMLIKDLDGKDRIIKAYR